MLISTSLLLVISNAVTQRRDKSILYSRIATTILLCCFFICLSSFYVKFQDKGLGIFSGLVQTTAISHAFHMFAFLITATILQLNSFYPRKVWTEQYSSLFKLAFFNFKYLNSFILNKMAEQYRILEYPLIILFVVIGGVFLMSSSDLITIFLAIELQSYGLYILCVVYRDSESATSGGLTYFLLGGLSSCFILLASALLYGNSGNTSFDGLYVINNISNTSISNISSSINESITGLYESNYLNVSLIILSTGFLFKISAAPFHFWSPDVYDAIPTIVTTFVAVFAKISILILLLELVHYTSNLVESTKAISSQQSTFSWTFTLLISSLLSLIIGAVLGLTQFRIKRLFAYSTISHLGFILLALSINSIESIQSFIFYLMQYSITNANAFILLVAIGYSLYFYVEKTKKQDVLDLNSTDTNLATANNNNVENSKTLDIKNSPVQLIEQLKGYFYINPFLALSLAITLFSFVGIPPLAGFFAKQMVLSSALDKGYVFITLIGILTSVISAYYYLVIVKEMYFNKSDYIVNPVLNNTKLKGTISKIFSNMSFKPEGVIININNIQLSGSISIIVSIMTLIILLFILFPQEWLNLATILALILFNC